MTKTLVKESGKALLFLFFTLFFVWSICFFGKFFYDKKYGTLEIKEDLTYNPHHIDYMMNNKVPEKEALFLEKEIRKNSKRFSVSPDTILAIMKTESNFKENAKSNANAKGLMQVIEKWHPEKMTKADKLFNSKSIYHKKVNIYVGTWVYAQCLRKYGTETKALLCYNGAIARPNSYPSKVLTNKKNIIRIKTTMNNGKGIPEFSKNSNFTWKKGTFRI